MVQRFVVVDLETTGNSPKKGDKVIEFACVIVENNTITDTYSTLINPMLKIPPFISELTTITDDMVEGAPTFDQIAPTILQKLDGAIFVAHNVFFDLNFLQDALTGAGYARISPKIIDTVEFAKMVFPTADSYKLSELSDRHDFAHDQPHRAKDDALVTARLLIKMIDELYTYPLVTLEQLLELSYSLKSNLFSIIEDVLHKKREHVERLDPAIEIFRGIALKKEQEVSKDIPLRVADFPETKEEKINLLQKHWPMYESRNGQFEMMDSIYSSIMSETSICIEAGTGVGKSLAYLLPLAFHSVKTNTQAVVSTYTVPLQHQLVEKELIQLEQIVPFPINYCVLKGRSHYLSLFKFEQSLKVYETQFDIALTKMQLLVWLLQTKTGDIDEVNLSSAGWMFWEKIKHSGWYQDQQKDPWISKDFALRARKKAKKADIIVTNHAYLLSHDMDASVKTLVIDEAHHLENAARNHSGNDWSYSYWKFMLGQLGKVDRSGYIREFFDLPIQLDANLPNQESMERWLADIEFLGEELFAILSSTLTQKKKYDSYSKVSIAYAKLDDSVKNAIQLAAERLMEIWKLVKNAFVNHLEWCKNIENQSEETNVIIERIYGHLIEWDSKLALVEMLSKPINMLDQSIWLAGDKKSLPNSISIRLQPVKVDDILQEKLFSSVSSTVLTSATLTVKGSFDYVKSEWGFKKDTLVEQIIPSPYEYQQQAKLFVPKEIPDIKEVSSQEYVEAISNVLIPLAQTTQGRMLILFTSYDMLRKTYDLLKESGMLEDYALLAQGISGGSRGRLTKNFTKYDKAILLGTSSFWEGIDIPGEDLSCLVMVRLPFTPLDEPIMEAKMENCKRDGKNVFSTVSLPDAIITFKQGFGRLIRKSTDKGIVVVFDRRITTTSYGKSFIQSIPPLPVEEVYVDELLDRTNEWLN
ncbi:ATP-dependent DNA helicase DinG [Mangrovibacillus cuniculi]|uniref:3'-5' exonuclease DinG n=1 Tax=Mangrovibacillus cuniculi TaxID=2593652 RepID=A0A7S8HFC4_9BACI|nr:ATP-dependent DNA helicase DinG [Mangrovibacillus cuniculi]QPC46673.1 ATP-dependent DNA helicase DinG [Mangrovibacillus cuniculi]